MWRALDTVIGSGSCTNEAQKEAMEGGRPLEKAPLQGCETVRQLSQRNPPALFLILSFAVEKRVEMLLD